MWQTPLPPGRQPPPGQTPALPSACWDTHTLCPMHAGIHPPPPHRRPRQRTVRILLECILALLMVYSNGVVLLCTKAEEEVEITEHSLQQLKKLRKKASLFSLDVLLKTVITRSNRKESGRNSESVLTWNELNILPRRQE